MSFVHLHLHTEYSLLDGECRIKRLPAAVLERGMNAVAITDHGVLYGAVDFFTECKKAGIKPIIGCEMYVAPRKNTDKEYPLDSKYSHLTLLVMNGIGYRNLSKLCSDAFLNGFYQKPRTDILMLEEHSEGLIALSGCLSGRIPQSIVEGDIEKAKKQALTLQRIFGADNFYFELMRHNIDDEITVNRALIAMSEELKIPLAATNDVHYIDRDDSKIQEILMAIQTKNVLGETDFGLPTEEFYLRDEAEMRKLFADVPAAVDNTVKIAERCNFEFDLGSSHLPAFYPPDGQSSDEYLRLLVKQGYEKKISKKIIKDGDEYKSRLEYELSVIISMGFTDYFLIVSDFVAFAKNNKIPVGPGRGSGAGSLCAYCLEITDVDPIKYGLFFERFLNPERISMPDFDIDFCEARRGEVINYVIEKYGSDHVAQIITFGTLGCRSAVRDVGRVMGMSYSQVDEVAKMMPRDPNITVESALKYSKDLKNRYESDNAVKKLLDYSNRLEGRPRNSSTHAAGVVITDLPITDYLPLSSNDGDAVTQFAMDTVAKLGLLKMDFLGLRYLTVLDFAEKEVKRGNPDFSLELTGFDDEMTYQTLCEGNSTGVFQLESEGMRNLLLNLRPRNLEDIINAISLYRPGPMSSIPRFLRNREEPEKIKYDHECLEEILQPTSGVIIYQEQVMQICRSLAGFSYGQADIIRRAMSRKKTADMDREKESFINGAIKNNVEKRIAIKLFDEMSDFAKYAFNKSHAAAYAVLSYRTAFMKCHYPREYICALLNSVAGSNSEVSKYIAFLKQINIKILPPHINESRQNFTVSGENIRFGLSVIKNVGGAFGDFIIECRDRDGDYISFENFLMRTQTAGNIRMTESLIQCGAFDVFGVPRSCMIAALDLAYQTLSELKNRNNAGQMSLFENSDGNDPELFAIKYPAGLNEFPLSEKLEFEKQLTGIYLSGHPLDDYVSAAAAMNAVGTGDLYQKLSSGIIKEKAIVTLLGILKSKKQKTTKNNKMMAFCDFEDLQGMIEIIVFPNVFENFKHALTEGTIVAVTGEATLKESSSAENEDADEVKLILSSVRKAEKATRDAVTLYIKINAESQLKIPSIKAIISRFNGYDPVIIYNETTNKKMRLSNQTDSDKSIIELRQLLGDDNVVTRLDVKIKNKGI